MRLGIRFAAWATPYLKEWHRKRHLNRTEGERHLAARNWGEAEKHFKLALGERRHSSKRYFGMLLGLKEAQRKQGKFAKAEQTAQLAIDHAAKNSGLQAQALEFMADLQLDQKKYTEAEATFRRMEALELSSLNPDFRRLAVSTRKLGMAQFHGGRPADAMKTFERAIGLSEKIFGTDHVETADAITELGARYREQGNHAEAQRHLRRALQIHRAVSGADSQQATTDLVHLAASLEESGDTEAAATEYEKILALKERQIGGDREQTAETQAHLAALYLRIGRTSAARELLTHAIGTLERKKGDPRLEFALEAMAGIEESLHRPENAEAFRERAAESAALRTARNELPERGSRPIYY